jgi:GH15 family glucan-1,4-alpha-glucosidase
LYMKKNNGQAGFWSGAVFGAIVGIASLISYQYFKGILGEPRLISKIFFPEDKDFESVEGRAMFIAAESLRSGIHTRLLAPGISKEILHAGYRNFRECWARDFGFASYGLIAIEQFKVVKETLEAFFWHQAADGRLPVKLYSMGYVTRYLHSLLGREQSTVRMLKPKYISAHGAPSLDGQAILVIAALHYAKETNDNDFLLGYWEPLVRAVTWLQKYRRNSLLHQGAYADWADSVERRGIVLYTNVLYWKALTEMANSAALLDLETEAEQYSAEAENVSLSIIEKFWRPELGYFVTSDRLDNLSSDGNLLAVAWGLAAPERAESILKVMDDLGMSDPVPTRVAYPSYPLDLISIENRLGGLANYHTDASWLWLGAWHLVAVTRSGSLDRATQILERITDVIVKDGQINEVHGPSGAPLSSFWYKSEAPLTWNAGMILYAHQIYEKQLHADTNVLSTLEEVTAAKGKNSGV